MGTTATTITGAIAEHEADISGLNSNIQCGHAGASSSITFAKPFPGVPVVVCVPEQNPQASLVSVINVSSVSATGFTVSRKFTNGSTWSDSQIGYYWVAIYK